MSMTAMTKQRNRDRKTKKKVACSKYEICNLSIKGQKVCYMGKCQKYKPDCKRRHI